MANNIRTEEELLALFSDNEDGNITAQYLRDFVVSIYAEIDTLTASNVNLQDQITALEARVQTLESSP